MGRAERGVEILPVNHADVVVARGEHRLHLEAIPFAIKLECLAADVADAHHQTSHACSTPFSTSTGINPPPFEMLTMSPRGAYRDR